MAEIDGGEMLIRVLQGAGIQLAFTLHGGHLDSIFQAALDRDFRLIDTRHEQAAGHAAEGYARTTGKIGVAMVTAGPGVTDVVSAVTNAYLDCIPTLFIGGAAPLRDAEALPLQGGIDQVALMAPITKWSTRVTHPHRIPDLVAQALRVATTGRPGPVFLEIPIDVLFRRTEEEQLTFAEQLRPEAAPSAPPQAVEQTLAWLAEAERPAILAGGGAHFSGAAGELVAFAECTGTPVFSNSKALGLVPADHPLCGRGFGTLSAAGAAAGPADLVLIFGARLGLNTGGRGAPLIPAGARIVQVDIAGEEIGRNREIHLGIAADCRETLRALNAAAAARPWPDRSSWQQAVHEAVGLPARRLEEALRSDKAPIHPFRLATEVVRAAGPEAILVADGGETSGWVASAAEVYAPGRYLSHGYLGCLGTGPGFAIAAKVAHPDRRVVCVTGDGSVGLNFAEFDTMTRHGLDIVTVISNDRIWGMSAHGQDILYGEGRRVAVELAPTRYERAAAGFGCHPEFVEKPDELAPALERAFSAGRPACVNVMIDPEVVSPGTQAMYGPPRESRPTGTSASPKRTAIPYYENLEES